MTFTYKGLDRSGRRLKGIINAENLKEALDKLKQQGVLVTDVTQKDVQMTVQSGSTGKKRTVFQLRARDIVLFARQLETMISAGVRLVDAVMTLSEQEIFAKKFRNILKEVASDMKGGMSFSDALERQGAFDSIFINMVRAGEEGGILDVTMKKVANYYENSNRMREQVKSSMAYPMFILGFAVVVVIVISVFILPKLITVFGTVPESGLLGLLMKMNFVFTQRWYILFPVVIAIGVGLFFFLKTVYGGYVKDFFGNLLPPVRKLRQKMTNERFTRTLGVLIGSGVSMINALDMAARASNNTKFITTIAKVNEEVKAGSNLKDALKRAGIFPQIIYEMVGTGEETGKLDVVMEKVADFYEEEILTDTKKLVSLVEPMMIAFVGIFIAFIAFTMYSTMFQMQNQLGK
ncbi:MAG TPA: type II secretion system F family protein [Fervidobacterium sp.]|nr:type II secretion system F family protein [Fervidobacterium sp.]NLH37304.1 type II secretion system F family protein [Thermotogaceae bacterium]HCL98669.1 type II secretion system F family protein [Fervidobacterium sp.]HOV53188.1 type II secretion system F family protein [Fervidobacterium sp.]HQO04928.1 type II secretion system F family protein [Fervidobacterium sp.]